MPLMDLIITLVVVGAILWVVNNYIPMQANVKKILNIVVVGVLILYLLNAFGILGSPSRFRFGRW